MKKEVIDLEKPFRVLAIGNSFSEDALQYVWEIARVKGFKNIILGNLFIGGCSLETHTENSRSNLEAYDYFKNSTGSWDFLGKSTMLEGIVDEDWDYITFQQSSGYSGVYSSYSYIPELISYVKKNKTNDSLKIGWHMTWAYQQDTLHPHFEYYNKSQQVMYESIVDTVIKEVVPNSIFEFIIPNATIIENLRTSFLGDTLTRDGFHLSLQIGRFAAGLGFFKGITGLDITDIGNIVSGIDDDTLDVIVSAVNKAFNNKFQVSRI
jgi:hypothetical protein